MGERVSNKFNIREQEQMKQTGMEERVPERMQSYQQGFRDGQATLVPPARVTAAQLATELMKVRNFSDAQMGSCQRTEWLLMFDAILERLEGGGKG